MPPPPTHPFCETQHKAFLAQCKSSSVGPQMGAFLCGLGTRIREFIFGSRQHDFH